MLKIKSCYFAHHVGVLLTWCSVASYIMCNQAHFESCLQAATSKPSSKVIKWEKSVEEALLAHVFPKCEHVHVCRLLPT